jgi:hypothetical protein
MTTHPYALTRRHALTGAAVSLLSSAARAAPSAPPRPAGISGTPKLLANWTFGRRSPDATIHDKTELDKEFRYRYIFNNGKLDRIPNCWSVYRDYPEGDPRSLHVFEDDALVLKTRIPPGGGLRPGGIESGMLRALLPFTPGMVVEMRAKLTHGLGTWPAFWLSPGVEYPDGHFSATPWPPEIDIFEFIEWQGRDRPRLMECHVQTNNDPAKYGNPRDLFLSADWGPKGYDPGIDFSAGFHTFALDWQKDAPIWMVDGQRIKQTRYLWNAPPAHILVTDSIGPQLAGVNLAGMKVDEPAWDYTIKWLRVWRRT